jgi:1-phosphofructokinase family hexose kinase
VILAAGLTPAWQQIVVLDALQAGHVNRARSVHWCASGKVLNVRLALHHLGGASRTLAVLGNPAGRAIEREFAAGGISARWVRSSVPTRVCTTILDERSRTTTELVENAGPLEPRVLKRFEAAFRDEVQHAEIVVLTGSLPEGVPVDFYRRLVREATCPVLLDVRGQELLAALDGRPWLVKPNRQELAHTVGRDLTDDGVLLDAMRDINARGAEWVVVTAGGGPVWATSRDQTWRFTPVACDVVNPIGCGDCLAAGIALAACSRRPVVDAIRFGIGAAADNVGQLLPARLDPQRVASFAERVQVTRTERAGA